MKMPHPESLAATEPLLNLVMDVAGTSGSASFEARCREFPEDGPKDFRPEGGFSWGNLAPEIMAQAKEAGINVPARMAEIDRLIDDPAILGMPPESRIQFVAGNLAADAEMREWALSINFGSLE